MKYFLFSLLLLASFQSFGQIDTTFINRVKSLDTANILRLDTLAPPNDALTRKIKQLRSSRHGLSIETVIRIKIKEEQEKDKTRGKDFYDKLLADLTTGNTSKLIENSLVNLYRRTFTLSEIKDLIKFYKTPAGKKMDTEFILLIVQSIKDAEQLMKISAKNLATEKKPF